MAKETQLIDQNTTTTISSNIGETITQVLSSLDHARQWDNKVDTNIEGHYTHQNMLEATNLGVSSPTHHKTGKENQNIKTPSHIHPSPLHPNVILWDLHTLKNIEGARNHFLKLVEVEANQHVMVPWELHVLLPIKVQFGLFHLLPYMLKKFDWEKSPLDNFKGKLASYQICPKGWDEWIDNMFMASFGLWTHKDQINHTPFY